MIGFKLKPRIATLREPGRVSSARCSAARSKATGAKTNLGKVKSRSRWDNIFFLCLLPVKAPPVQACPSPEYPGLQEQLYEPLVLMHIAPALQLNVPKAHSSTSKHEKKA